MLLMELIHPETVESDLFSILVLELGFDPDGRSVSVHDWRHDLLPCRILGFVRFLRNQFITLIGQTTNLVVPKVRHDFILTRRFQSIQC